MLFVAGCVGVALPVTAHLDGPPPAHTGGFGEPTCHECHWEQDLNHPDGALTITGVPDSYVPGQSYRLEITLTRSDIRRGGFQLAARFAEGEDAGRQAGVLRPVDSRTTTVPSEDAAVIYAQQTTVGSEIIAPGGTSWTIDWTPPVGAARPIVLHVAANAGNDDDSDLGDFIYTAEVRMENQETAKSVRGPSSVVPGPKTDD